jgi:hypothetical protein
MQRRRRRIWHRVKSMGKAKPPSCRSPNVRLAIPSEPTPSEGRAGDGSPLGIICRVRSGTPAQRHFNTHGRAVAIGSVMSASVDLEIRVIAHEEGGDGTMGKSRRPGCHAAGPERRTKNPRGLLGDGFTRLSPSYRGARAYASRCKACVHANARSGTIGCGRHAKGGAARLTGDHRLAANRGVIPTVGGFVPGYGIDQGLARRASVLRSLDDSRAGYQPQDRQGDLPHRSRLLIQS